MLPLIFRFLFVSLCLVFFEGKSQETVTTFSKADGLTSLQVTTSLVDSKGLVWFGTVYGLNVYTGTKWIPIKNIEDNKSGKPKPLGVVSVIFEDLNKNIWVSSDRGLFLYNRNYWTFFEAEGDKEYVVKDFLQERSGAVWMTLEYFQDFDKDLGFSIVSGKLQMYKEDNWYKFDNDVAGTTPVEFRDPLRYFTALFQDRKGRVWFSTLEGVFMFNGKKWKSYKKDDLDAKKVYDLIEDKKGVVWAATENGVSKMDSGKWKNYSKKNGLADNSVFRIIEDADGRKWTFSQNDIRFTGLSLYENGSWKAFDAGDIQLKGEIEEIIRYENNILAFSKNGVSEFKDGQWNKLGKEQGLIDKNYSLIINDKCRDIWLAGDKGLYRFNGGLWELMIRHDKKREVDHFVHDKRNRIWIGTNKSGVFVFSNGNWDKYNTQNGLADNHVSTIFEDRHGNIWVVTKKGISKISAVALNN